MRKLRLKAHKGAASGSLFREKSVRILEVCLKLVLVERVVFTEGKGGHNGLADFLQYGRNDTGKEIYKSPEWLCQ